MPNSTNLLIATKLQLLRILLRLLAWPSLQVNHALGAALGTLLRLLPTRPRRVTTINLALCYPEKSAAWRQQMLAQCLRETGKTFTELGPLWHWSPHRIDALVRECHGWELVEQALAAKRGLILLTPHAGSWEFGGLYIARRLPITSLYKPPRRREFDPLIKSFRERDGARLVPIDNGGIRALYRALAAGEAIGILPDQEPTPGAGVFVPFMGVSAYTMVLLNRLARKSGAPVIIGLAERLPAGRGFRLWFRPGDVDIYADDPVLAARAVNRAVEQIIAMAPTQYMWNYKRFQQLPDGSKRAYR